MASVESSEVVQTGNVSEKHAINNADGNSDPSQDTTAPSGELSSSSSVEIGMMSDEQVQEVSQILQERGLKSNPMRAPLRAVQCEDRQVKANQKQKPWINNLFQYLPVLMWLPKLDRKTVKSDLVAGLTVGVMAIPQSMSYASIAGLQYVYGMYSACVPTLIYGFFGHSRQLAVGPVAMVSLLVEAGLQGKLPKEQCGTTAQNIQCPEQYANLAFLTAAIVGMMQIIASILRLGFIVSFLGHPVTSGFTSGAAIIIGLSQVKYLLGYDVPKSQFVYETLGHIISGLDKLNGMSLLLGITCIMFLMGIKKMPKKTKIVSILGPVGPLVLCIVGTLLIWLCAPLRTNFNVKYVGSIPDGLMPVSMFEWNLADAGKVLPTALSACLIGYMESIAIGKNLAAKNGYEIGAGQEMLALGVSNLVGAMFSCYPVTGSFSRSAVNNSTGARTQLSGIITAAVMFCTLLFLTPLFYYLPKFVLAAIVINSVISLVAVSEARRLFTVKKHDFVLWIVACVGTLFLGVLLGIIVAVSLSLAIVIYESVRPQITILWRIPGTSIYRSMKQESNGSFIPNVFICRIGSSMYFANASYVKDMLLAYVEDIYEVNRTEYIVIEMTPVITVDSTALHVIKDIVSDCRRLGIQVAFAMVGNRVEKTLRRAGLIEYIGSQWILPTVNDAVHHCLRHQHVKRKARGPSEESHQISIPEVTTEYAADCCLVQPGTEIGFSNDLHHACTMAFLYLGNKVGLTLGDVTALLKKEKVIVLRAVMELVGEDNFKHTYFLKSARTAEKLSVYEMERLREELGELINRSKRCDLHMDSSTMPQSMTSSSVASPEDVNLLDSKGVDQCLHNN